MNCNPSDGFKFSGRVHVFRYESSLSLKHCTIYLKVPAHFGSTLMNTAITVETLGVVTYGRMLRFVKTKFHLFMLRTSGYFLFYILLEI